MEHYTFNCGKCGASYNYVGYKTGIGKNEAQLKQMADDAHVCRECGYDDRTEEGGPKNEQKLDWGDNPSTASANMAAGLIGSLLTGGDPDEDEVPTEVPVAQIMEQRDSVVDLVLKGLMKQIPKCCIEFYVRCVVGGLDAYGQGGVNIEPRWGIMRCPACAMSFGKVEEESEP